MEVEVFIRNLSSLTTQAELGALFAQAGDVTAVKVIRDLKNGESKGFAYITMSALSEADKAVNMFDSYSLSDHTLKVRLVKPRKQRGVIRPIYEA
jgi:RNA recognition motif-containing protein